MAEGTQLYKSDKVTLCFPITNASDQNVNGPNDIKNTQAYLDYLNQKVESNAQYITKVEEKVTGADQVKNDFAVNIRYAVGTSGTDFPSKFEYTSMHLPDNNSPYAWKLTEYLWANSVVARSREVISTALYPETQFMFCSASSTVEVGVPVSYVDGAEDTRAGRAVLWYKTPRAVSAQAPNAYMATRTRDAGESWSQEVGGGFHAAMYGRFAFDSVTEVRYGIEKSTGGAMTQLPDPNSNLSGWKTKLAESDFANSGTYKVYQTVATKVNNAYVEQSGKTWSDPSLISIITK